MIPGTRARKRAGKRTIQIALPPRFPAAPDRVGGSAADGHWDSDWAEKFKNMAIPPVPTFDEEMSSVEERADALLPRSSAWRTSVSKERASRSRIEAVRETVREEISSKGKRLIPMVGPAGLEPATRPL